MRTKNVMPHTIILKIGLSERQSLDQTAHVLGVSMSKIIRDLINSYMGDYVRHYEYKIAKLTHPDDCNCKLCSINKFYPELKKTSTKGVPTEISRPGKSLLKNDPTHIKKIDKKSPTQSVIKINRTKKQPVGKS